MVDAYDSWTVLPHGPFEVLANNLWRVEGSLPHMGLKRVMTVARMGDGRLLVHSAIALDEPLMRELESFGEPAFLVVPNGWHRLDARAYKKRYPSLRVYCPRGARAKVEKVVSVDGTYDSFAADDAVQLEHVEGMREAEGVLRVRSDDGVTLVFNDLIFNLPHGRGLSGLFSRLMGSTGGPKVTPFTKLLIKDRKALREHLQRLAQQPELRRIVVSHGRVISQDATGTLERVAQAL